MSGRQHFTALFPSLGITFFLSVFCDVESGKDKDGLAILASTCLRLSLHCLSSHNALGTWRPLPAYTVHTPHPEQGTQQPVSNRTSTALSCACTQLQTVEQVSPFMSIYWGHYYLNVFQYHPSLRVGGVVWPQKGKNHVAEWLSLIRWSVVCSIPPTYWNLTTALAVWSFLVVEDFIIIALCFFEVGRRGGSGPDLCPL